MFAVPKGLGEAYSHRKVVLKNDRFSSVLLTRRKTQTMQRIGEDLQRRQRRGGNMVRPIVQTMGRTIHERNFTTIYS